MRTKLTAVGCFLGLALVFFAFTAQAGTTYYVTVDGDNAGDGLGWDTSFASIRHAALTAPSGSTILVSNGVYHVDGQVGNNIHVEIGVWPSGKDLVIEGVGGAAKVVLDGGGGDFHAIGGWGDMTSRISGITVTNFGRTGIAGLGAGRTLFLDSMVITDCTSGSAGGGIRVSGGTLIATDCIIKNNTGGGANSAGGIYVENAGSTVVLDGCIIEGNTGGGHGGGLHAQGGSVTLRNCRIIGNQSHWSGAGVLFNQSGYGLIENTVIADNESTFPSGVKLSSGHIMQNSLIVSNRSVLAVMLFNDSTMRNCTIVNNPGGGIRIDNHGNEAMVVNSIMYHNDGVNWERRWIGGDLVWSPVEFINCIMSPDPGDLGTDCIVADPMLDAEFKPLRGSPAINAGLNQEWMDDATDKAGNARILMGTVDIGAYEYVPAATLIMVR